MDRTFMIRMSIDQSPMDLVMNPDADSLFASRHEFTVKSVVAMGMCMMVFLYLIIQGPLHDSGTVGFVLWIPSYLILMWLLCGPTETHELGLSYLMTFYNYFINGDRYRYVSTRRASDSSAFLKVAPVKGITPQGKLVFTDNSVGYGFELVGNASILMFASDRQQVLTDVRNFYRNIDPSVTLTFDSVLSGQRVVDQLNGKDYQLSHLPYDKPFLPIRRMLQYEQIVLRDFVGRKFKALHQYVIVRGPQDEDIDTFTDWLNTQVTQGSMYVKDYRQLTRDELIDYLKNLYSLDITKKL